MALPTGKQHSWLSSTAGSIGVRLSHAGAITGRTTSRLLRAAGSNLPGVPGVSLLDTTTRGAKLLDPQDRSALDAHSPLGQAKILEENEESYDLTKFVELSKNAANSIKSCADSLLTPTGTPPSVDVLKFGELGTALKENGKKLTAPADIDAQNTRIEAVNKALAGAIEPSKLTAPGGEYGVLLKLSEAIEKDEPEFQQPQQIIEVLKLSFAEASDNLQKDRMAAEKKVTELFDTDTTFQNNLVYSLGLPPGVSQVVKDQKLKEAKTQMLSAIKESFDNATTRLKEATDGKPASKDKEGKDIAEVVGFKEKAAFEKESAEADLIQRAHRLKDLERFGTVNLGKSGLVGHAGGGGLNKKARLKKVTNADLENYKFTGNVFGYEKVVPVKTKTGQEYTREYDGQGNFTRAKMKVSGELFRNTNELEVCCKDMVDDVIAHRTKDRPTITFNISCENRDDKVNYIKAAYKAAREKGIEADQIFFNVTGGDPDDQNEAGKYNGKTKSAEVLALAGLGNYEEQLQGSTLAVIEEQMKDKIKMTSKDTTTDSKSKLQALKDADIAAAAAAGSTSAASSGAGGPTPPVFRV